jgi:hypothetical protein
VNTRRRWWVLAVAGALVVAAGTMAVAYLRRIGPQFPAASGTPYSIAIGADGCPVQPDAMAFVDAPGQFVAPDPAEVVLCTRADWDGQSSLMFEVPPLQRTLSGPAAGEFAALLNELPDRNTAWRDWQRAHSGLWPDAPWENGAWDEDGICVIPAMSPFVEHTLVLRYPDGHMVALLSTCHGWTDGTRTRLDTTYTLPVSARFVALLP